MWCRNGKLHREDGPAIEYLDGTQHWFLDGVLQNEQHANSCAMAHPSQTFDP
jgi:hypothetical protein